MTPEHLAAHLPEVLAAVRQEDIPRVVCEKKDGPEVAAIVNAASLDRLIAAAERAAEQDQEPVREKYARHLDQWRGERRALLEQMGRLAEEIAAAACPKCARRIRERWGGEPQTLGEAWRTVLDRSGLAPAPQGVDVIVSGTALEGRGAPEEG